MEAPRHSPRLVRFGTFEIDLLAGELRKAGVKLKLAGQPFQVLTILLERPGEVVTREELQTRLWPDTFVDVDHNLNTAINKIREVLSDSAESPRLVETLPRRGYRFIAAVEGRGEANAVDGGQVNSGKERAADARHESGLRSKMWDPPRTRLLWLGWGAVAVFVVASTALYLIHFRNRPSVSAPVQFQFSPSGKLLQSSAFAVSPDGRHLAFATIGSDGVAHLWIRNLDSLEVRALSDSHPASVNPPTRAVPPFFWSPDSRFIGFQMGGKLAKIEISGGPAQTLCDMQSTLVGGSWNRDGLIVFADHIKGLMQVSAAGGVASPLTTLDPSRKEVVHVLPSFLPDGQHFLYLRASSVPENSGIYIGSVNSKPQQQATTRLLATTSGPIYVPSLDSDSGHVLFLRQGTLMAQPFDALRLKLSGEAVPIAEHVGSYIDYGFFSASRNGVLVYRSGAGQDYQLTWIDRQGRVVGTVAEPGRYNSMAVSPSGKWVAVSRTQCAKCAELGRVAARLRPEHQHAVDLRSGPRHVPCLVG